jgi:predicted esterase
MSHILTSWRLKMLVATIGLAAWTSFPAQFSFAADKQAKTAAAPPDKSVAEPGKIVEVDDPQTGKWKYWVPKDYTPDRSWPIIYCYHGMGQTAVVWPFRNLTDRVGFILVGMEYVKSSRTAAQRTDDELANLKRIHNLLAKRLQINDRRQFIGGFSMGGWWTSVIAEKEPTLFAGVIILGAGRPGGNPPKMTGLPIFIGIGENDPSRQGAEVAAAFYRGKGAAVTLEIFKGRDHSVDTDNAVLKTWLKNHGLDPGNPRARK